MACVCSERRSSWHSRAEVRCELVTGRNTIPRDDGSIKRSRGPVASIAALRRDIAMNQTDASDAGVGISRSAGTLD